jgi:alpha-galactosidase
MRPILLAVVLAVASSCPGAETVSLTSLDLANLHFEGWTKPKVDAAFNGKPLSIGGQKFQTGIGTRALSTLWLELDGHVLKFTASVGVDDSAPNEAASACFSIIGDGRKLWTSGAMKRGEAAKRVELNLKGVRSLLLKVDHVGESNNFDHADWADASFVAAGRKPTTVNAPHEEKVILTPKPPRAPRINGPAVYGCRPGHPFIYRIPTTGERPIQFATDGLPLSLKLDGTTGIITGSAPAGGTHTVTLHAKNRFGSATREIKIISGDTLALTPPMGWNHWYAHYARVTDIMMREAADVMVRSGMADVGYSYVNIDDCWENAPGNTRRTSDPQRVGPLRDDAGNIIPNTYFPNMRALTDYVHAKGLKAGIYTSPGPLTCGGFCGAYGHEEQDAKQFAEWGFDFLKYDWCSYSHIADGKDPNAKEIYLWGKTAPSLEKFQYPYRLMGGILKKLPRDVVFNLCQYGMGDVWEWGAEVGGQSWRTGDDLGAELNRIFSVALKNATHGKWSKPGAWNDPDYIQIGYVGDARGGSMPKPCPMTPTEQYSFMSLWSLMASPLFYSGDMSHLDPFTINVLCNPEVIEVDQDPLGACAEIVKLTEDTFLMVKRMEDGSKAVGLCNRGETKEVIIAKWSDLGLTSKHIVRDLWRQKDLGKFNGEFKATVPRHGVVLVRIRPAS